MIRNEYRRAFIMLRATAQGYGGHVRLERRTLTGSMYFIVTAPEEAGPLRAALAGRDAEGYFAAPLGELSRDRRGQLTLARAFDPRNIDGRALESYAWVAVTDAGRGCAVVLTGNVEGSREVDPIAMERAVRALYAVENAPAADLPEEIAPTLEASAGPESLPEDEQGDIKIYTGSRTRVFAATSTKSTGAEQAVLAEEGAEAKPSGSPTAADDPGDGAKAATARPASMTAARRLGLDITRPWSPTLEPLRRLFATQAPLEDAPDAEYVYISAPMPQASGFAACLVGLKAESGSVTGLRYALPARYSPLPPAGLENYRWLGGGGEGYWVLDMAVE